MENEEFEKEKDCFLQKIKKCRREVKKSPDSVTNELVELKENILSSVEDFNDLSPNQRWFYYRIDIHLFRIIDHLGETGKWRIPCAVSHFGELLGELY